MIETITIETQWLNYYILLQASYQVWGLLIDLINRGLPFDEINLEMWSFELPVEVCSSNGQIDNETTKVIDQYI